MQRENSPNQLQKRYSRGTNFFGVRLVTLHIEQQYTEFDMQTIGRKILILAIFIHHIFDTHTHTVILS